MSAGRAPGPRRLDLGLHLLDRQVVDVHRRPVCKVDDVELTPGPDGRLRVTGLLVGPGALGPRTGGAIGRLMLAVHRRFGMHPQPSPPRIPVQLVQEIDSDIRLVVPLSELDVVPLEDWVREHLIDPLPGSGADA